MKPPTTTGRHRSRPGVTADRMLLRDDGTMWLTGRIERQHDADDIHRLWVYREPQPE